MIVLAALMVTPALAAKDSGFTGKIGLSYGLGSAEDADGDTPPRVLNAARGYVMPGWRIGRWVPGVMMEYRLLNQATNADQVGNVNYKGSGYQLGVGVSTPWNRFEFATAIKFFGEHSLSNKVGGNPIIYRMPIGAFLAATYQIASFSGVDLHAGLNFDFVAWNQSFVNGADTDISGNSVKDWGTALEIGARL